MTATRLAAALVLGMLLHACGGESPEDASDEALGLARKVLCQHDSQCSSKQLCSPRGYCVTASPCTTSATCGAGLACVSGRCRNPPAASGCHSMDDCGSGGLCENGACVASACEHRAADKTGIRAVVRITRYQGLITGRNGTHEIAYGTITSKLWVHDPAVFDTANVELALNVASATDPAGLPHEIPLAPGASVELEGEYISGATAGQNGVAVLHFTHSTCGFVSVGGATYQ